MECLECKKMNNMFGTTKFNGDISNWDVSNVYTMRYMFRRAENFNRISNWNVSMLKLWIVCLKCYKI